MTREERDASNQAAAERLKPTIDADYPKGQFVAVYDGRIIADDADFDALGAKLDAMGLGRMDALIDQAGDDLPSEIIII